jgi:transcriptional regulator GlxA family with amidase domain
MTGVEDHAPEGRRWHERPDGVSEEVVHDVPAGVHEPRSPDEAMRTKAQVGHAHGDGCIRELPQPEAAAQVHAAGTCDEDGIEVAARRVLDERHDGHEDDRSHDGPQVVGEVKRRRVVHGAIVRIEADSPSGSIDNVRRIRANRAAVRGYRATSSRSSSSMALFSATWPSPARCSGVSGTLTAAGPYEVRVCSAAREVTSEHVTLGVPWRLSAVSRAHTVIIPGVDAVDRSIPQTTLRSIRRAVDRGARVASMCSGAFVLAATGALDGLRATTHWQGADELAQRHPRIQVDADVLYVDNGQILTSAGAAAGLDLCLHLVRRDHGAEVATMVARATVMPLERSGGQAQFIVHEPPEDDGSAIGGLLVWLEQNLRRELPLSVIARRAAMSTRTLSRRFREQVGTTPALWVATARIRRAQRLLETTGLPIERVAAEAGFGSAAVLRERFGRVVGTSPQAYRRSFTGALMPVAVRRGSVGRRERLHRPSDSPVPSSSPRTRLSGSS